MLAQKLSESPHVLLQSAIGHVGPVTGKSFRLRQSNRWSVFVWIAEDKFARFDGLAGTGCRVYPGSLNLRLRQPVPVTEMVSCIVERWDRV